MKRSWMAVLCLVLTGCVRVGGGQTGENREVTDSADTVKQVMTCTSEAGSYEFNAQGDQVTKSVQTESVSFEELGLEQGADAVKIEEAITRVLAESYGSLEGVDASGAVKDGRVEMTVSIDYETADHQALIDAGLLEPGELDSQYVSLERTQSELQSQGFACRVG